MYECTRLLRAAGFRSGIDGSVRACPGTWLITKNDVPMTSGSSHSTYACGTGKSV